MTKTITKIGNSQGVVFDAAFMDLARLKLGDELSVSLHEGGAIVLLPLRRTITEEKASKTARRLIRKNAKLFKRLS
jgi:antitoxin component of MazEF toxin-antitoxin module